MTDMQQFSTTTTDASPWACDLLRSKRVVIAGLGNIGSFLAVLIAPLVSFVRLIDRDTVESGNLVNQFYLPEHAGQPKVDAVASRIDHHANLVVERRFADLEDIPWGDFADVDFALAGLDTLRARQILSEKVYPLQVPYIDGAVGEPLHVRTQVLLPGQACLECAWGDSHYRQLSTEYSCSSLGTVAEAPPTAVPGSAGAAVAGLIVAQCLQWWGESQPRQSYEINGDLLTGRFLTSRRKRNTLCRFRHEPTPHVIRLSVPFAEATVADLVAATRRIFRQREVSLEFRRGILGRDLFGSRNVACPRQLHPLGHVRLGPFGLTPQDRIVVRSANIPHSAHVCLDSPHPSENHST